MFKAMSDIDGTANNDGVIVLGVNLLGEAKLASTVVYDNHTVAWVSVDQGPLHSDNTVDGYQFEHILKSDVDNCYIIKTEVIKAVRNLLCVNTGYVGSSEFDVYYSNTAPFFMLSLPVHVPISLEFYLHNLGNIKHYSNFKEVSRIFSMVK